MSVRQKILDRDSLAERVGQEVAAARREIRAGRFQRSMAVIAAFAAIASGFEAYIQHLRGAFANRLMWTPIVLTPPMVVAAAAALFSGRLARTLLPAVSLVTLAEGILGFVLHLRGIGRLPGRFKIGQYNVVIGPPVFAPLLMSSVGITGMIASVLKRERWQDFRWNGSVARAPRTPPEETGGGQAAALRTGDAYHTSRHALAAYRESRERADLGRAKIMGGRLPQGIAVTAAFFALLAGGEAYFEHLRGSFNRRVMWVPVWVTPPMIVAAIWGAFHRGATRALLPAASAATFFAGLLGFGLHLRGIRDMPGGFSNMHFNITLGPPLFAPLLFTAVGLLGFIATLVGRKEE